jgi:hypothetical protein
MTKSAPKRARHAGDYLRAVPHPNEAMTLTPHPNGAVVAAVPMKRPKYLVPPISWVLPFSPVRKVELDRLGASVLAMCDGRCTVEKIIEKFAAGHKLTFREAQLSVTQFLRQLTQRGLVVIVGLEEGEGQS